MNFNKNKILIFAIALPFLSLLFLTFYKGYSVKIGTKVTLPISGYDPRDILSGHYVTYRVEYGVANLCEGYEEDLNLYQNGCVCLFEDPSINYYKEYCETGDSTCSLFIKGKCSNRRFIANVERYYIPEAKASEYDRKVRSGKSKVVLSVKRDGSAMVEKLILADE